MDHIYQSKKLTARHAKSLESLRNFDLVKFAPHSACSYSPGKLSPCKLYATLFDIELTLTANASGSGSMLCIEAMLQAGKQRDD